MSEKRKDKEIAIEDAVQEVGEDATKYGEFVSSYFAWVTLPGQKKKAEEMQEMTKKEEKKSKNVKNKE